MIQLRKCAAAIVPEGAVATLRVDVLGDEDRPETGKKIHFHYRTSDQDAVISDKAVDFFRTYIGWLLGEGWKVIYYRTWDA